MIWRRDGDSNPGGAFTPTRFPGVRLKPLGHPSVMGVCQLKSKSCQKLNWPDQLAGKTLRVMRFIACLPVCCNILNIGQVATSPKTPPLPGCKIYCQRADISSHCGHGTFMPKSSGAFCDYYRPRPDVAGFRQRRSLCAARPDMV